VIAGPIAIEIREWETASPATHPQLAGACIEDGKDVASLVEDLGRAKMLEIRELKAGLAVTATSFVGRVQVGNLTVTVLPKLKSQTLVHLLRYAYGLSGVKLCGRTLPSLDHAAFQDILVSELLTQVQDLVSRGLHRAYVRREEDLASPRGRIAVGRLASQGGRLTASLPCSYHPRTDDCLLNRVVAAGLGVAAGLANDATLRRETLRLAKMLRASIRPIRLEEAVLHRAEQAVSRLTSAYLPALAIIRLLLDSLGVTLVGQAGAHSVPGFLFDMNRFFQALLSRFLRENLPAHSLVDEYRLRGVIEYDPDHNPKKRSNPTPRPDFVVLEGNVVAAILDAKYRDLWEKPLPREMLYQLAIYAALHEVHAATILYPSVDAKARPARLNLNSSFKGDTVAHVWLRPVHVDHLKELVTSSESAQNRRQRRAYAEHLAFGAVKSAAG